MLGGADCTVVSRGTTPDMTAVAIFALMVVAAVEAPEIGFSK